MLETLDCASQPEKAVASASATARANSRREHSAGWVFTGRRGFMPKAEKWTLWDLITPATVLIIGAIAVTVFVYELRNIEARLTDLDSKIADFDAKIDRGGEDVEKHLTETDKRLTETINRLDRGLDQQADMSSKINKIDADLTFIHKRIDMLDQPKARGSNPPH